MKTSLVTGGAGFLGSWLTEDLLKKGHKVIIVDNLLTARKENASFLQGLGAEFVNHDITKPLEIKDDIDFVFHLASPASPKDFSKIPIEIMLVNSLGTLNALNIAREKNARFLLTSSSEVYGDPKEYPQKETYYGNVNPIGPRSCYDEGKRFAEALTMSYFRQHGLDAVKVRIFNCYGPRLRPDDGRIIPNFVSSALRHEPIVINGDGTQTRSFCYVEDLIDGIERAAFSNFHGEVFNIGNPDEKSVIEIAQKIIDLTGSKSKIEFKALMQDDPVKRKPDVSKARELLGWEPRTNLDEGLRKTTDWFRNNT